jgi:SAM-dependent methyltransferase
MEKRVLSKAWDWSLIPPDTWKTVADEFLPVALRWKELQKRKVLDLGCGRGRNSIFLAEMGFEVTAIDLSPAGIEQLQQIIKQRKITNIKTLVCDMLELPFENGSFDCVLAFLSIGHTDYKGLVSVIDKITNLLVDSGRFYVTFNSKSSPGFKNPANKVIDDYTIIKTDKIENGIPHTYLEYDDVLKLMAGFRILKIQHIQDFYARGSGFHYFVEAEKA